jgi:hypothetical protein
MFRGPIELFDELAALQMHFRPGQSRYVRNFKVTLQGRLEKCDRQGVFALSQGRRDRRPQRSFGVSNQGSVGS